MLSNSQKEHLTYTAIGQIFTLVALWVFSYQYIMPGITALGITESKAQSVVNIYNSTVTSGIEYGDLAKLLQGKSERSELIKVMQSDPKAAAEIIKKPIGIEKSYLDWLKWEIWNSEKEKDILKLEKAKLNSIIPTMSPLSNNIEEDNITLRQYVRFIESSILKRFNFDSNVVIGMQGISFGVKGSSIPENLGMFEFRLDFKWTNANIIKFIDYINTAGKPDILSYTGSTTVNDRSLAVLSNPLITMESFSLQEKLDKNNPNKENNGRATLKFYVRWVSKDDLSFLKENLKTRQIKLITSIDENVKLCEKDSIVCASYNKKLSLFQIKYREYERSSSVAKIALSWTDEIYALSQSVNTLKSLEKEFELILPKTKK